MNNRPRRKALPANKNHPEPRQASGRSTTPRSEHSTLPAKAVTLRSPHRLPSTATAVAILVGGIGLVAGGIWLSVQLIFDPDSIVWVNQFLPEWTQIPVASRRSPQTLTDILANTRKQGLAPGDPIILSNKPDSRKASDFLLPIFASQPNCQPKAATAPSLTCQQIVELRIYQPTSPPRSRRKPEPYYQMVSQVGVEGPEEAFAIVPLLSANAANLGADRPLPLTQIRRFEGTPNGIWLYLSGQRLQGSTPITYGQIAHYNPKRGYLNLMQQWTSTTQVPYWRQVTGGGAPELVVEQTVGLDPRFEIYQLKPRDFWLDPIQLEEIDLSTAAIDHPTYAKALLLAKSGLWSTADQWLQSFKRRTKTWTPQAQAQLDAIHWHAQATHAQAEKAWSSPSQQVLANLIDGRWTRALAVFQASDDNRQEITTFLKTDSTRLWQRVSTALKINPAQPDIKAWGALILASRQGKPAAIAWLRKQPRNTASSNARILALLSWFDRADAESVSDSPLTDHASQLIGTAQVLKRINPAQWLRLQAKPPLRLEEQQTWYEIQVNSFYDGNRWRKSPWNGLSTSKPSQVKQLWSLLGLDAETPLQVSFWLPDGQQETIDTTIQAVQLQGNSLRLLAAGAPPSSSVPRPGSAIAQALPRPLAFTATTLQWLEPGSTALLDFIQQEPDQAASFFPTLWQQLLQARLVNAPMPETAEVLQTQGLSDWMVQTTDLTGDNQPETILTLDLQTLTGAGKSQAAARGRSTRTLIFSPRGTVLYNELTRSQSGLIAIANASESGLPVLVIDVARQYSLLRWSPQKQRFE